MRALFTVTAVSVGLIAMTLHGCEEEQKAAGHGGDWSKIQDEYDRETMQLEYVNRTKAQAEAADEQARLDSPLYQELPDGAGANGKVQPAVENEDDLFKHLQKQFSKFSADISQCHKCLHTFGSNTTNAPVECLDIAEKARGVEHAKSWNDIQNELKCMRLACSSPCATEIARIGNDYIELDCGTCVREKREAGESDCTDADVDQGTKLSNWYALDCMQKWCQSKCAKYIGEHRNNPDVACSQCIHGYMGQEGTGCDSDVIRADVSMGTATDKLEALQKCIGGDGSHRCDTPCQTRLAHINHILYEAHPAQNISMLNGSYHAAPMSATTSLLEVDQKALPEISHNEKTMDTATLNQANRLRGLWDNRRGK